MERRLPASQGLQQYGLSTPQMVILVYRPRELAPLLQVAVGDVAPDALSRYVMVVGSSSAVTIANYQIDNLLRLIKAATESGQGQATSSFTDARLTSPSPDNSRGRLDGESSLDGSTGAADSSLYRQDSRAANGRKSAASTRVARRNISYPV